MTRRTIAAQPAELLPRRRSRNRSRTGKAPRTRNAEVVCSSSIRSASLGRFQKQPNEGAEPRYSKRSPRSSPPSGQRLPGSQPEPLAGAATSRCGRRRCDSCGQRTRPKHLGELRPRILFARLSDRDVSAPKRAWSSCQPEPPETDRRDAPHVLELFVEGRRPARSICTGVDGRRPRAARSAPSPPTA